MDTNTISNIFYFVFIGLGISIFTTGYLIAKKFIEKDNVKASIEYINHIGDEMELE